MYVNFPRIFYKNKLLSKLNLCETRSKQTDKYPRKQTYVYEIPETYQKSFFLANATLHDNINWYYHRGVEVAFNKFLQKIKYISPCLNYDTAVGIVLNRINLLDCCSYTLEVNFPLTRDSGKLDMIKGYCVKHGIHYPTHLGGLRLCENLDKPQLRALASLASYKHVCVDIPFAGAHSGIKINPRNYSQEELRRLISIFIEIIREKNFLGNNINIFEPELNCSTQTIESIINQYKKITGNSTEKNLSCITGKPIESGGIYNFEKSTAVGIFHGVDNFLHNEALMALLKLDPGWTTKTYVIKGLGKLGSHIAEILAKEGAKCIGVCETNAGYYDKKGIDIKAVIEYKKQHGSILNFFPVNQTKNKILSEECDLLIIASSHQTLTCYTAPNVKCKIVVEGANGAITPTAHKILLGRNILVIPDIYINCGSSIAAYLEYIKNMENDTNIIERESTKNLLFPQDSKLPYLQNKITTDIKYIPEVIYEDKNDFIQQVILSKINGSSKNLMRTLEEFKLGLDLRTAAYVLATEKIFELLQNNRFL